MGTDADLSKVIARLGQSYDLAAAHEEYADFCKLLKLAAENLPFKCQVEEASGEPAGIKVQTPCGIAHGRFALRFTGYPHATVLFDDDSTERNPLWAVHLDHHEHWVDCSGEVFKKDFATDRYGLEVGRATLTNLLKQQIQRLNADADRYNPS